MLLEARDEDGEGFAATELRDQMMHLLFGGHDTTSSTLVFLCLRARPKPTGARALSPSRTGARRAAPTRRGSSSTGCPHLSMASTRRCGLYPPVWFGPRMAVKPFSSRASGPGGRPHRPFLVGHPSAARGVPGPRGVHSRALQPEPAAGSPRRLHPVRRRARICIGKRFGQLVVKAVATTVLQRFRV